MTIDVIALLNAAMCMGRNAGCNALAVCPCMAMEEAVDAIKTLHLVVAQYSCDCAHPCPEDLQTDPACGYRARMMTEASHD
ncbi:hypothetical protein UFOVP32_43 [uncultured Caudovirales phage]|uniref:Uncharacterized protein n=1 Tax=uncultured Caudovirales phage TaxID=2100421 RepID=A0A6J5KRI3_9CAUD|nr:hypothetical protein UFOVP32_43 [uncultured Caudovirales phage]CAB4123643.1 hypothetical protein UFOVP50_33 [uncultured Caudovirales phage]